MQRKSQEVLDLYASLKTYYEDFHNQCKKEDTYYNLEFDVECAEDATPIHLPTAQEAIDDATAQVDSTSINIFVPPRDSEWSEDVDAALLRRYLLGCWHMVKTYDGLVIHHMDKHAFLYGMGVLKVMAVPGAPFEMPVEAVNPQNFFPDPARRFVIECYQRKGLEVQAEFPEIMGEDGETTSYIPRDDGDGEWIEYWDDTHCMYLFEGEVILEMEHSYGFLPYFWGDAGLGYRSADVKPEALYRGLLYDCHDLLEAESRLATQSESISKQYAWPEIDVVADSIERAKKIINEWELGPGRMRALDRSCEIQRHQPQSPPPEILRLQSMIESHLEDATVPRIARGERPSGASSGYMTAILSGLARLKFGGVVALTVSLIQQVNEAFLKLVENVFGEMTVYGMTAAREQITATITDLDIEGHYINFVDISAIPPEEQERTLMVGSQLLAQGQISRRYFINNYLKPTDPEAELEQIYLDQLLDRSPFWEMWLQKAFEGYEAQEMLESAGAPDAARMLADQARGTLGAPVPPQGGMYAGANQSRGYARPTQAGSLDELSQILKAIGGKGVGAHVSNARRDVADRVKKGRE